MAYMPIIEKIVVHESDSPWGDVDEIRAWHTAQGWDDVGYHFVILNGRRRPDTPYDPQLDGVIQRGRPVNESGAHARGLNDRSIGICLIGRPDHKVGALSRMELFAGTSSKQDGYTAKQMMSLHGLLYSLREGKSLSVSDILGHYEVPSGAAQGKTCPMIDMDALRYIHENVPFAHTAVGIDTGEIHLALYGVDHTEE